RQQSLDIKMKSLNTEEGIEKEIRNQFSVAKPGEKMIFICRFIPAVRHVISIPAGTADMKFKKFILYTAFGGLIWNGILLVVGTQLQKNWDTIIQYSQIIDAVVIAAVILVIIWFFGTKIRNKNKGANKNAKTGKENKKRARRSNNSKSKRIQRKKAKTN
ncbi:MAG: DedA family protein, partial [Candidatus Diapherotrites archaeon]|nr:DedA family protein [Candidatus Diapherotrites archaeon]